MKRLHQKLLIGTVMAALGLAAAAQSNPSAPAPASAPAGGEVRAMPSRMERGDPERFKQHMAERHAKRMTRLKAKLQLSAAQEGAWTSFNAAMQPPAAPPNRMAPGELEKLSTPERIELMRSRMAQRDEAMRQRGEATKTFYAGLNAEQKKVFDQETLPHKPHWQPRGQ